MWPNYIGIKIGNLYLRMEQGEYNATHAKKSVLVASWSCKLCTSVYNICFGWCVCKEKSSMLQPFQLQRSFQIFQDQIFRPDLCFAEPEGPLGFVTKHEILFGYLLVLIKSQGSILTTLGLPYQFGGLHPHLGFTFNFSEIFENSFFKKLRLRREHAHHHIFRRAVCPWPT